MHHRPVWSALLVACQALLLSGLPAPAAFAQVAEKPAAAHDAAAPVCVLHVWPGSNLRSTYHGWFHGGIVDGAVTGRDGYQKLPAGPLDTERQREILAGLDLAATLGLGGYKTVLHDKALESRVLRQRTRWIDDHGPCQAELAVDDVFFQEDVVSGRYLKVIYRYRRFGPNGTMDRSFGQIVPEKLIAFPPAAGADPAAGLAELGTAFRRSTEDFGRVLKATPQGN